MAGTVTLDDYTINSKLGHIINRFIHDQKTFRDEFKIKSNLIKTNYDKYTTDTVVITKQRTKSDNIEIMENMVKDNDNIINPIINFYNSSPNTDKLFEILIESIFNFIIVINKENAKIDSTCQKFELDYRKYIDDKKQIIDNYHDSITNTDDTLEEIFTSDTICINNIVFNIEENNIKVTEYMNIIKNKLIDINIIYNKLEIIYRYVNNSFIILYILKIKYNYKFNNVSKILINKYKIYINDIDSYLSDIQALQNKYISWKIKYIDYVNCISENISYEQMI